MTNRELKRLSRGELLEMLIAQSRETQALRERLEAAEAQLREREITINNAGSIAEAALRLNGVFEAAQGACKLYTDNIRRLEQRQEALYAETKTRCAVMLETAREDAERIRSSAGSASGNGEHTYETD